MMDKAALRQSIEALALELALRDPGAPDQLVPLVARVVREAEAANMQAVAEAASAISLQGEDESALRDAIDSIQQMVAEPQAQPLNQDPELIADFVMESREHLAAIEIQLLALEHDPRNAEAINTIFRGFHTIKGLAGFLEFPVIQQFAHEVETLLDLARNSKLPVDSALIDIILQSGDFMSQCVSDVGQADSLPPTALIARIQKTIATAAQPEEPSAELTQLASSVATPTASTGIRSVKVDTSKLDYLVDMVGELVIAQSLIRYDPDLVAARSARLSRNLTQLTRITADVQKVAMAMRMIPVGQMFQRMQRLVRDLARKSGKQAVLELSGEETDLDRNMVEELADPLMHMVRNAVDHGTETPAERAAAGKDPTATLRLKAYHQGGFINIEVADDGRGLSRDKILAKARERGLVSGGDHLSDQEVFSFIFEPGFSTAQKITDVSGRGVGMDVVRRQIMKLRGRVDISSREGAGATFLIRLPLRRCTP